MRERTDGALRKPFEAVVLVHGLWMPSVAMTLLARRLESQGFAPRVFGYHGREPLGQNVRALAHLLRAAGKPSHLVAHSLGGLLVLEALNLYPELEVSSAVLLAAPVRGSVCGRRLAACRAGAWLLGATGNLWVEHPRAKWLHAAPVGVIAGSAPWGLGRLLGPLPAPNDGVVCVCETALEGISDRMVLKVNHSGMLISRAVASQVAAFLRRRRFDRV